MWFQRNDRPDSPEEWTLTGIRRETSQQTGVGAVVGVGVGVGVVVLERKKHSGKKKVFRVVKVWAAVAPGSEARVGHVANGEVRSGNTGEGAG
jgi:hypothetical protein